MSVPEEPTSFLKRHIGPSPLEEEAMLKMLGFPSAEALTDAIIPRSVRALAPLQLPEALSEPDALVALRNLAQKNRIFRSYLGMGYSASITPAVIRRNVLENPDWYTPYTPYQAEISQGRLEALLTFQTLVADLTGMEVANASLLDADTAAAEAMTMCARISAIPESRRFLVSSLCHPQTVAVVQTHADPLGIVVDVGDPLRDGLPEENYFGVLLPYPATNGIVLDYTDTITALRERRTIVVMHVDPLALTLFRTPGELGADIAIGSTQRFGLPLGYGGPHPGFLASRSSYLRKMPGRIVGISRDREGRQALRLALQTREQHIRREKATSNICTAQALPAVVAAFYAIHHGPAGLRAIAESIRTLADRLANGLAEIGLPLQPGPRFDTVVARLPRWRRDALLCRAQAAGINLRRLPDGLGISLDETTREKDLLDLFSLFAEESGRSWRPPPAEQGASSPIPPSLRRRLPLLPHPIFHRYKSETELVRYIRRLSARDISLTTSMIPLGSCTMKLNAAAEMLPMLWDEFSQIHPFCPREQASGYQEMLGDLERWLKEITGMAAVSFQPAAGSQGEFAGLLAIRAYHRGHGEADRDICLLPVSAHGTNAASAAAAGFSILPLLCDQAGRLDLADLGKKLAQVGTRVGAIMITYPSTYGFFEDTLPQAIRMIREAGGLVYLDGANANAFLGLCRPGELGVDVCHLNLHKTFAIPHGGGGPGAGPIAVSPALVPFLPSHPFLSTASGGAIGAISGSPWGNAGVYPITWMFLVMMGARGLTRCAQVALLSANYIAYRLAPYFPLVFSNEAGLVAHECIVDLRPWKDLGIEVDDVAKRLADFNFHAPTVSWPIPGTLMIEPTESESKEELDRFCDAMIMIHGELEKVRKGEFPAGDNPVRNAPHTATAVAAERWDHSYSRERALFPLPWLKERKYWPPVARVDAVFGDRHPSCTWPKPEDPPSEKG
ncbi:aminomethyl-transferring glycine dehydrogenase [Methylacidimicrobium tartarophylax]|uniref:glycine dehydrogenase (aminomethyl-transferring) n=1 Tax=Methylacidimicrobium tartarophylax TaxID=1041768 RepID=A0A5E6M7M1_9BACT|nr:aminomethyl-transferring glycine dehydrogenase [Methylacidimicrobium tartarophylax]VVM04387.1 glycine dehydrogenase [Methylacidimicrobium tartarophylax]